MPPLQKSAVQSSLFQVHQFLKRYFRSFTSPRDTVLPPPRNEPSLPPGFKWIEGRGFKVGGSAQYPFPTDTKEINRLNLQHYMLRSELDGNYLAPVHDNLVRGIKVLDVGCGTGIWSMEMAKDYPASDFTGTDVVDVFKDYLSGASDNCHFQVANTLDGLPFADCTFHYVFQRLQVTCFRTKQWPGVIKELVRVTKPGGWIELIDSDFMIHNGGPRTTEWIMKANTMLKLRDIDPRFVCNFGAALSDAGLVDVVQNEHSIPFTFGSTEVAAVNKSNIMAGFTALKPQMVLALGMDEEEYDNMVAEASNEMNDPKYKSFNNVELAYGRKPGEEASNVQGEYSL